MITRVDRPDLKVKDNQVRCESRNMNLVPFAFLDNGADWQEPPDPVMGSVLEVRIGKFATHPRRAAVNAWCAAAGGLIVNN